MTDEAGEGRRETRKRETRAALHEAAMRLTSQHGFQAATVADIAAAAGVSPRTFFSYFPSKEAALFSPLDEVVTSLEARLAPGHDEPRPDALDTFRSWLADELAGSGVLLPFTSESFHDVAAGSEGVSVHGLRFIDRVTRALAQALRAQLNSDPLDPIPDSAAAAVVSAGMSALPLGGRAEDAIHVDPEFTGMLGDVDRAIAFVRAGLAGI